MYSKATDKQGKPIHKYILGVLPYKENKVEDKGKKTYHEIIVKSPVDYYLFLAKAAQRKVEPCEIV